ncbi:MAG: hypothetical protein ACI4V4_04845 [Eubacterium sp.]
MSSTNKTSVLKLNQWSASDKPLRSDFNYDNQMIEKTVTEHMSDSVSHITAEEREVWNAGVHYGLYFGNGELNRSITTDCPFEPKFVLVFASARPASYSDFDESRKYNYIGFASQISSMANLSIGEDGTTINVTQDVTASYKNEYVCLNQSGVTYTYIMFR